MFLFDVNSLIALFDSAHLHHGAVHDWFERHSKEGWATCPITETGLVRILAQRAYRGNGQTPSVALQKLEATKRNGRNYHFLPDAVSLADSSLFHFARLAGSKQVTDAYLLGLAFRNKARLVSFDRNLPWQAIRGADATLVVDPSAE